MTAAPEGESKMGETRLFKRVSGGKNNRTKLGQRRSFSERRIMEVRFGLRRKWTPLAILVERTVSP